MIAGLSPYEIALYAYPLMAAATFGILLFIDAPYGRHIRQGWGPTLDARPAWVLMELPAVVAAAVFFLACEPQDIAPWVLFGMWQLHYVQRTFVYPALLRGGSRFPVVIVALAFVYNLYNAAVNHLWLGRSELPDAWLSDPRFIIGAGIFLSGWVINLHSDQVLRRLKAQGQGYQIPRGGLYRWVSCPNYFGEMMEWFGFALAAWSWPALGFAIYTVANLGPRAIANHRWYRERFPDYPPERRALIPGVL